MRCSHLVITLCFNVLTNTDRYLAVQKFSKPTVDNQGYNRHLSNEVRISVFTIFLFVMVLQYHRVDEVYDHRAVSAMVDIRLICIAYQIGVDK